MGFQWPAAHWGLHRDMCVCVGGSHSGMWRGGVSNFLHLGETNSLKEASMAENRFLVLQALRKLLVNLLGRMDLFLKWE